MIYMNKSQYVPALTRTDSIYISYLRVYSMLCIVFCHFLQAYNNNWAWVFNIGVQVFLLISGFLYGHKHIDSWKYWFYHRFIRIYIPYFLFLVIIIPSYARHHMVGIKHILVYILDLQGVMWGGG